MFCFARGMNGSFARLYTSAASGGSSVQEQLTPAMPRWVPFVFYHGANTQEGEDGLCAVFRKMRFVLLAFLRLPAKIQSLLFISP